MTNSLSDEELEAFLKELELYATQKKKPKAKVPAPFPKKESNSLKISLIITLSITLFSLVQAAFTVPLYTKINRVEKRLEVYEAPLIFPPFPEEEIIEQIELPSSAVACLQ